jgi:serine phosphatase RsbU (regulator of sigma subunit)
MLVNPRHPALDVTFKAVAEPTAQDIRLDSPVLSPSQTNNEAFQIFTAHPQLVGLPVVEAGRPLGLINRGYFMDSLARPFRREIFDKKSCTAFMDDAPLIVETSTSIQDLSFLVVDTGKKALTDGFIMVENGHYAGMGVGLDLVRMISTMQAQKNRIVMESINYASVIQRSYLRSSRGDMTAALQDHFVLWEPRDVVGGDYYYFSRFDDGFFVAVFDCTGHGVPGAFMTLIMASALDHVLTHENRQDPAAVMATINRMVKVSLGQVTEHGELESGDGAAGAENEMKSDDGMDAAFCWFDTQTNVMTYAGARTPVLVSRNNAEDIDIIEGDRKGVGYAGTPMDFCWNNREVALEKNDCAYIATDGITDQIGGERQIAFGRRRLKELLRTHRHLPMSEQRNVLKRVFYSYQGAHSRRDDVTLFGFRV